MHSVTFSCLSEPPEHPPLCVPRPPSLQIKHRPYLFILPNLWPSNRLHRGVWTTGNVRLCDSPVPGSNPSGGHIYLPSVCLSMIRIIWGELGGNATNVKQYMLRISAVLVHNGALCWAGSRSLEGNVPWREGEKCVFFFYVKEILKAIHTLDVSQINNMKMWTYRCKSLAQRSSRLAKTHICDRIMGILIYGKMLTGFGHTPSYWDRKEEFHLLTEELKLMDIF